MFIRQATYSDLDSLMQIFEGAKLIMRASGNMRQWDNGYPSAEVVRNDIDQGNCYVLCEGSEILGTMALIKGPDHTYSYIEGKWTNDDPYYVIHRIATSAPGRNVAKTMFDWAFEHIGQQGCFVIRIDTHKDNCIMQHILAKYGFTRCGVIYLDDGAPREAYIKKAVVPCTGIHIEVAPSDLSYAKAITSFQVDMAMESEGFHLDYERTLKGVQAVLQDENNKKAQTVYQKLGMSECHDLMYEVEL